ncbi:hypothetical protein DMP17_08975 [Pseudonocardia sp. TMWB2A]
MRFEKAGSGARDRAVLLARSFGDGRGGARAAIRRVGITQVGIRRVDIVRGTITRALRRFAIFGRQAIEKAVKFFGNTFGHMILARFQFGEPFDRGEQHARVAAAAFGDNLAILVNGFVDAGARQFEHIIDQPLARKA